MTELVLGSALVLFTLCIRLITAHHMKNQRYRVRQADSELKKISSQLHAIMDSVQQVERQQRQFSLRRSRLLSQIATSREELERLRRPVSERLAA